ncbi:MAG: ribosome biogenesis GTPase Der [Actinobacteria bacterium]|nr:ribosome biogenesis GTPase Der [Actinomycetota bacterium]
MKKLPKIAIIGKPNAGKSSLINRLCSDNEAIVHEEPMITRDRKYYKTDWNGMYFNMLDTGGIDLESEEKLSKQIWRQSEAAIRESDIIIFLVDLKSPISPLDEEIADILRKSGKPLIFVGNKWDSQKSEYYTEEYLKLGFGYPVMVSAIHGLNITELLDEIIFKIRQLDLYKYRKSGIEETAINNIEGGAAEKSGHEMEENNEGIAGIAILGQPNSGKSTLFNKILKEERVIVDEAEGTTRDSIDSIVTINERQYRFIDTAGLKRDKVKEQDLEFYSKIRTLKTVEKSEICLILIDATKEITNQDQKIVRLCLEKGASVCIVFNKTDAVDNEKIESLVDYFNNMLEYIDFVPFLKISALKDVHFNELFEMIEYLLEERLKKISENKLMALFKEIENESAVYVKGKKFRIKFIRQIKISPPGFLIFSNMDVNKKTNIKRFIENNIRDKFGFTGTPLFFKFKH